MVSALSLIVREGPDENAEVRVAETTVTIGRAHGNDLLLRDPAVSRRHLEATLQGAAVLIRACEGAAPFVVRGDTVREAKLAPGQTLLVGDTVIEIVADGAAPAALPGATRRTDVLTLFDGASAEVRGLSALFQLTEALDRSRDRPAAEEALRAFLVEHARAVEVAFEDAPAPQPAQPRWEDSDNAPPTQVGLRAAVIQHSGAISTSLKVPTGLPSSPSLTVRLAAGEQVSDPLRRLLVVAARVFASRAEQLRELSAARAETESLRALAADPTLVRLPMRLDALEEVAIKAALEATHGDRTRAAVLLGIDTETLDKKLGEEPPEG